MKTAKEFVDQINAGNFNSPHCIDDEIDMAGVTEIDRIDLDEHRWYVIGTVVFQVGDEFFGVWGPVSLKSESMGFDDIGVECQAFEMEAVPAVTYRQKIRG